MRKKIIIFFLLFSLGLEAGGPIPRGNNRNICGLRIFFLIWSITCGDYYYYMSLSRIWFLSGHAKNFSYINAFACHNIFFLFFISWMLSRKCHVPFRWPAGKITVNVGIIFPKSSFFTFYYYFFLFFYLIWSNGSFIFTF